VNSANKILHFAFDRKDASWSFAKQNSQGQMAKPFGRARTHGRPGVCATRKLRKIKTAGRLYWFHKFFAKQKTHSSKTAGEAAPGVLRQQNSQGESQRLSPAQGIGVLALSRKAFCTVYRAKDTSG
jgi:hypothetical protein